MRCVDAKCLLKQIETMIMIETFSFCDVESLRRSKTKRLERKMQKFEQIGSNAANPCETHSDADGLMWIRN